MSAERNRSKPWTIDHGFRPEIENLDSGKKMIERASEEQQNDANFILMSPSSEESRVRGDINNC